MKILFITDKYPPEKTTVGLIVSRLSKKMQLRGHTVSIIATVYQKTDAGESMDDGVKIFRVYTPAYQERWRAYLSLYNPSVVKKVRVIVNQIKPDVVHVHNIHYYLSYFCLKIAKQSGAKVFLTAHDVMLFHYGKLTEYIDPTDLSCPKTFDYRISWWQLFRRFKKRYNPFRNVIIRHYLKYTDKVLAVSGALKDALEQNGIRKVARVWNGIDLDAWKKNPKVLGDFMRAHDLLGKKVILFGGKITALKGAVQAVNAMARVIETVPEAVLIFVGSESAYSKSLSVLAKRLSIEKGIIFAGWQSGDSLTAAFRASDLVLTPSICFDSFPTVILEAMACEKPVITTCFGGAREMVVDGQTGYVVNPFDTHFMADKIIDLLLNPERAERFGYSGHKRAGENFSIDSQIDHLLEFC